MIIASSVSTIEGIIPYVILAGVIVFIVIRLVVGPLLEQLSHARRHKNEHTE